jgi:hypothetical protein
MQPGIHVGQKASSGQQLIFKGRHKNFPVALKRTIDKRKKVNYISLINFVSNSQINTDMVLFIKEKEVLKYANSRF